MTTDSLKPTPPLKGVLGIDSTVMNQLQRVALSLEAYFTSGTPYALALVSPRADEGRSYMAAALALAYVQMGKRCLLVEADAHHPVMAKWFDFASAPSSASPLSPSSTSTAATPQAATATSTHAASSTADADPQPLVGAEVLSAPGLRVLVSNQANPLSLRPDDLTPLIQAWKRQADVVILDTPRGLRYTDAQMIAPQVDGCLLVAREGFSYLEELTMIRDQLSESRAPLLGCIYNAYPAPISMRSALALHPYPAA